MDLKTKIESFAKDIERKGEDLRNMARDLERLAEEVKNLEKSKQ
jgi:hypothetical protein